jgi:hypothetical protein
LLDFQSEVLFLLLLLLVVVLLQLLLLLQFLLFQLLPLASSNHVPDICSSDLTQIAIIFVVIVKHGIALVQYA